MESERKPDEQTEAAITDLPSEEPTAEQQASEVRGGAAPSPPRAGCPIPPGDCA